MNDSAMLCLTGAVNPLVARAVYPALGFPLYSGEVCANNANNADREAARQSADAALSKPLAAFNTFFMADCNFIDGSSPSTAEMCLASTLKFLNVFACGLPQWASTYMKAVESELGAVYAESAADVRGYIGLCWVEGRLDRATPGQPVRCFADRAPAFEANLRLVSLTAPAP